MENLNKSWFHHLMIVVLGALLFIPFLGKVHLFDWDEANFAEIAREMLVAGDFLTVQINYIPFWEKPPFFFWLQVVSMKAFGINEFAARLPNALCGIITLLVLYHTGKRYLNQRAGLMWVLVYAGSILPFLYFKSGIIDPWFNLFIFLGLICYINYAHSEGSKKKMLYIALSGAFIGLAITTKGPVGLLLFGLTIAVYFIINKFRIVITFRDIVIFGTALLLFGGMWFIIYMFKGRFFVIRDFIDYHIELMKTEDAGHGGFFLYHFVVLFFGVFPASVLAIKGFKKPSGEKGQRALYRWMFILFVVVLVVFSLVKTKIIHYSSLAYFPLTYFAVIYIDKLISDEQVFKKWMGAILISMAGLYTIVVGLLAFTDQLKQYVMSDTIIKDQFALGNLEATGGWSHYEVLIGVFFLAGVVTAVFMLNKRRNRQGIIILFTSTMLFTLLTLIFVVPKVERYTQHAAIEFYKERRGEDCYIKPLGFKSYAHLFYFRMPPPDNPKSYNEQWLLKGDIDKTVYFVTKNFKKSMYLKKYEELELLYEKNGFVFLKRIPK